MTGAGAADGVAHVGAEAAAGQQASFAQSWMSSALCSQLKTSLGQAAAP